MAQFVVRNIENGVKDRLQRRARRNGHSMEEEVRDILRNAVLEEDEVEEAIPIMVRKLVEERQMMHTEANRLSEVLLDRRVQLFGGDPRLVTNVEAARDADGLRVRARSTVLDEDMARLTVRSEPVAW